MAHPVLLWFRDDRRLTDQAALNAALATGRPVLPVYVLDDEAAGRWAMGGASRWWLHHSLAALAGDLEQAGAGLVLRRGSSVAEIAALVNETGASAVYTAGSVEPWARALDRAVADAVAPGGVAFHRMRTTLLFSPEQLKTKAGGPFGVYTPFSKACLALGGPGIPTEAPARIPGFSGPRSDRLEDWGLLPTRPAWAGGICAAWTPGEVGGRAWLHTFVTERLARYAAVRDEPAGDVTSMLSPYLHHGEVSARSVRHAVMTCPPSKTRDKFIQELLWREFSQHLLWHNPDLPEKPLRPAFAAMPWRDDPAALRSWQRGRTGVPIVDAGMRQLWETGWMHNRVRLITASFLIKHLLLPWQAGEAWFWDTLVDADLGNNAASWQWVAGCGADAAPYFRIFNPVLQGLKFDPDGVYIHRFVPELARLDGRFIHAPWEAPSDILARAEIELGRDYPMPLIDLGVGRARALEAFEAVRRVSA